MGISIIFGRPLTVPLQSLNSSRQTLPVVRALQRDCEWVWPRGNMVNQALESYCVRLGHGDAIYGSTLVHVMECCSTWGRPGGGGGGGGLGWSTPLPRPNFSSQPPVRFFSYFFCTPAQIPIFCSRPRPSDPRSPPIFRQKPRNPRPPDPLSSPISTAPSHYLKQCWLIMGGVVLHSPDKIIAGGV